MKKSNFDQLYPGSHSVVYYPKLLMIGKGWNVEGLVNQELCLPAQLPLHHSGPVQCLWYRRCCTKLPVHLLRRPQDTSYSNPKGGNHRFPAENHGLRFRAADSHRSRFTLILSCQNLMHSSPFLCLEILSMNISKNGRQGAALVEPNTH